MIVIWGGGYAFQKTYVRDTTTDFNDPVAVAKSEALKYDWTSNGYVGPMFLYMFYGFFDGKTASVAK